MAMKPTFVIVHGAFHDVSCMEIIAQELQNAGYPAVAEGLKSIDAANVSIADDASYLREDVLMPLLNQGTEVVLLAHSYGGLPGGAAVHGLSKTQRGANGQPGGVVGMIYLSAFIPFEGISIVMARGDNLDGWCEDAGVLHMIDPIPRFYNDLPEDQARWWASRLRGQSLESFVSTPLAFDYATKVWNGRRAYVKTQLDGVVKFEVQGDMIQRTGVHWEVREINAAHSPFLSKPKELVDLLDELARGFMKVG